MNKHEKYETLVGSLVLNRVISRTARATLRTPVSKNQRGGGERSKKTLIIVLLITQNENNPFE